VEQKEYLIDGADKLFSQFGIKSVTMDDIARHLGISKKTIYQHFADKNELVETLIASKISVQGCIMEKCCEEAKDAVDEILHAVVHMQEILSSMNPMLFYDLQKYHPKAWKQFLEFKEKAMYQMIHNNLERGIREGNFRPEINTDIITRMRLTQVDVIFNQVDYPYSKYSLIQVMVEITNHYLYGICTLKGYQLINTYKQLTLAE